MRRGRRILVAVTGLSPQVVTETVYALAVQRKPAWIPTEIRVISTSEGAERAKLTLLGKDPGWFHRLRKDYRLPPMRFDESLIRGLKRKGGGALDDIRTEEDNLAAADALLEEIADATAKADEVHVSIAGGRKTMGFFAGYALSLVGREQDALSHVLVEPPFESHPDFFYPSPTPRIIYTPPPQSRPLDASRARVTLAEIPFVRLRRLLEKSRRGRKGGFARAVQQAQEALRPRVVIRYGEGCVEAGGERIPLRPAELAFYGMIARAAAEGKTVECPPNGPDRELAARFLAEYRRVMGGKEDRTRTEKSLEKGMDRAYFLERKSRISRAFREALGSREGARYEVRAEGRRPATGYSLSVAPGEIEFAGEGGNF
ncbi:MAG: CRISPR-associated ring nuclease Csm6 [Bryobacteraceae bacterium]